MQTSKTDSVIQTRHVASELGTVLSDDIIRIFPKEPRLKPKNAAFKRARKDGSYTNGFASPIRGQAFAAFIPDNLFSPQTTFLIGQNISGLLGYRQCDFSSPSPNSKRPRQARTPRGTILGERIDLGSIVIYLGSSNSGMISQEVQSKICEVFANCTEKDFSHFITPSDIEAASSQSRSSQEKVAGLKASKAAEISGIEISGKQIWHWMHLIAFFMIGKNSQTKENLVAGTKHANFRHLFVELEVPYLLKFFPEGITVSGKVIENEHHVAKSMQYNLETDDFTLSFTIDMQSLRSPNQIEGECVHQLVKAVLQRNEEKKDAVSFVGRLDNEEHDCKQVLIFD